MLSFPLHTNYLWINNHPKLLIKMPDIYYNRPLNKKSQITILSYTVELDEVISTDTEQIDRRHIRTDEFFEDDILSARRRASEYFLKESKRLKPELENNKDNSRHLSLMLYYTFQENDSEKSGEYSDSERCYLMDVENNSTLELLDRLQQEYYHLIMAGVVFDSIEVEMKGELYFIPLGGLFEISGH